MTRSILNLAATVVTAVLATTAPTLSAQMASPRVVVNVPFAFEAGTQHFAAGKYTLSLVNGNMMVIKGASSSGLDYTLWNNDLDPSAVSKVVFHHYGTRYFLRDTYIRGRASHMENIQSSAEARAIKELSHQTAANHAPLPVIEVGVIASAN